MVEWSLTETAVQGGVLLRYTAHLLDLLYYTLFHQAKHPFSSKFPTYRIIVDCSTVLHLDDSSKGFNRSGNILVLG